MKNVMREKIPLHLLFGCVQSEKRKDPNSGKRNILVHFSTSNFLMDNVKSIPIPKAIFMCMQYIETALKS